MIEALRDIYSRLGDALSRTIFIDRLDYSITGENSRLEKMIDGAVRSRKEWKDFCGLLEDKARQYLSLIHI